MGGADDESLPRADFSIIASSDFSILANCTSDHAATASGEVVVGPNES